MERGVRGLGLELSASSVAVLVRYVELLLQRAVPLGMIGPHEAERVVPRHVLDSLRAVRPLVELDPRRVVDLGSGAGLPGIPLAVALPDVRFVLAEQRSKRAAFLELVVERLDLSNVDVHADRAETLGSTGFDVATARAFAPASATWDVARPILRPGGALVLFAGSGAALPHDLPEATTNLELVENAGTSVATLLASAGSLVIIRKT